MDKRYISGTIHRTPKLGDGVFLSSKTGTHAGAARIDALVDFAMWPADPAVGKFTGPPLVRTFTAAAKALAVHGELAEDAGLPYR